MNNLHLVLGGPGCGKTTRLLEIVQLEMAAGVAPSQIAFVSFTKEAVDVAKARAAKAFTLDPKKDLPWFRTIHSLAYARMQVSRDEMMEPRDWREFGTVVNERMSGNYVSTDGAPVAGQELGDTLLRICDYAATTLCGIL